MERAELKKRVRALLISSRQGCTPNGLFKDYKSAFGEALPLNEFGYRSVVAMAEDMPDVIRIQIQGGSYGVLLRGVADDSTRHIAKMVSRQKNTGYHQLKSEQPVRKTVSTPSIPFHIQGCLRQLMIAYPNGLPIEQFEEAYARRFGYYLSLRRLKCNSLQELINNVPDVLKFDKDANGRTVVVGETGSQQSFYSVESDNLPSRPISQLPPRFLKLYDRQSARISNQLSNYDSDNSPVGEDQPKVGNNPASMNYSSANGEVYSPSSNVSVEVKVNIVKLLDSKKLGIWSTSLQKEYQIMFGYELELSPYRNTLELLSNLKDVCVMVKPSANAGDWLVKCKEQLPSRVEPKDNAVESINPGNYKDHITKLMQGYPDGISLQDLPILFKEKHHYELPMEKLGFNSIASLVNSISDVVKKVIQNGQLLIIPVAKSNVVAKNNSVTQGHVVSSVSQDQTMTPQSNGIDAVAIHKTSVKKPLLSSLPVEPVMSSEYTPLVLHQSISTINVAVSHAVNPSKFFIQLIGKDNSHMLNTLMETMSKFYCSVTGVEQAIARPVLGQACCALFDGDGCWYRGEVIGIPTPFTVLIKYVDYGNVCELPIGSIRKSQSEYLVMPAQSIECCLANVKPNERVWHEEACKVFLEAVSEKPLVAFIQQSMMGHPLHITLCDTSTKEDVYIHELLISKNLAVEIQPPVTTPTSSDVIMKQFFSLQQTLLLQHQMLQQHLMVNGQLQQRGQISTNGSMPSWQPQGLKPTPNSQQASLQPQGSQSVPNSQQGSMPPRQPQGSQPIPNSRQAHQSPPATTNSEHRKKMAAAKDIWSSDSETEDEKAELSSIETMKKQLEIKLEKLHEERRNIIDRMTYSSSSGSSSISSLVEKLQNIEAKIRSTNENMKRRANGVPLPPPPGLSHMYPAKQQMENVPGSSATTGPQKPKGVTTASKPIIGLGRGKRFSKQNGNSTPPASLNDSSPVTPVGESAQSFINGNNGMYVQQDQLYRPRLSSGTEVFSQEQPKRPQISSSEVFRQDELMDKQQFSSSSETSTDQSQSQSSSCSEILNSEQSQKSSSSESSIHNHRLSFSSKVCNETLAQGQVDVTATDKQRNVFDKNSFAKLSISSIVPFVPATSVSSLTTFSSTIPAQVMPVVSSRPMSIPSLVPATSVSSSTMFSSTMPTGVTTPSVSSRPMSYSAVASQPARKPPPPQVRPQQQQPFSHVALIPQQSHLLPLPNVYGPNHPHIVGLGRGNGPWSGRPPPHSWAGNAPYMQPMHFNYDHSHSPFYEIPPSGLHNPFYPIPPMGSSSGLDII